MTKYRIARLFALILLFGAFELPAHAQQTQRLYKGAARGSEKWTLPEAVRTTPNGGATYTNVRDPELIAWPADPARANGTAVIMLPGGALRLLSVGQESQAIIKRFNDEGISVFVLKYRVLQVPPPVPGAAPASAPGMGGQLPTLVIRNGNANPAPGNKALDEVLDFAIADAQQALRMVRADAAKWKIDPARVGFVGSSAGGGVAIGTVMKPAKGAVPDFILSLYGPSLMDVTVPADAPPLFMATESNHGPVTDGLLALFSLWKAAKRPAELLVYEVPNFSFPASLWLDRSVAWMREQKILPPARP